MVGGGGQTAQTLTGFDPLDSTKVAASREGSERSCCVGRRAAAGWRRGRDYGTRSDEEPLPETGGLSPLFECKDGTAPSSSTLIHNCSILPIEDIPSTVASIIDNRPTTSHTLRTAVRLYRPRTHLLNATV